jgi:hypothetical protein
MDRQVSAVVRGQGSRLSMDHAVSLHAVSVVQQQTMMYLHNRPFECLELTLKSEAKSSRRPFGMNEFLSADFLSGFMDVAS